MVVLESNNNCVMSSSSANQYLSPDYLPPLPVSLDAKNSPLALLAQTCSQIGADSSNIKPLISSLEKSKKTPTSEKSPPIITSTKSQASSEKSTENRLAFKPYEANVLSRKVENGRLSSGSTDTTDEKRSSSRTSSRKSASASPHATQHLSAEKSLSPTGSDHKSTTPNTTESNAATRAVLDPFLNINKDSFRPPLSLSSLASLGCSGCPTALDASNPAFRMPFNAGHFPHPSLLEACFQSSNLSPYVSYSRVKTPAGTEAVVPVCKDPYCFSCRLSMHGALGPCPPGCMQCDTKYSAAAAAAALMAAHPLAYQYGRPFICNWVSGDSYCGKRFRNSEELLQHLRTHTSSTDTAALMSQLRYPASHLNQLAASARYHPYSKPMLPPSLASSPFSAFNPTLSPYYSPYSLYDQRVGAAVNP